MSKTLKTIIIAAGILISLCICGLIVTLVLPGYPATEAPTTGAEVERVAEVQEAGSTNTPVSEEAPAPTATEEPTSTPEPTATLVVGDSQDNPVPFQMTIAMTNVTVGIAAIEHSATDKVLNANMFNTEPDPGNEYILLQVSVECTKPASERCNTSLFDFKLLGSSGLIRDAELMAGLPESFEQTEMSGGAIYTGWLGFIVGKEETNLTLSYEPFLSFNQAFFEVPGKP